MADFSRFHVLFHDLCLKHHMGTSHPESPARLAAVEEALRRSPLWSEGLMRPGREASREEIAQAHDHRYVDQIFSQAPSAGLVQLDADTSMNPFSLPAARRAVGCVLSGIDLIMRHGVERVFCAVRPPGHHAEYDQAMGFCLFNNVAVGVRYALERFDLKRVAVIDFDVHHGNGTEDILQDDKRVLFCSSFQHPFYPFSDLKERHPRIVHTPLHAGSSGRDMRRAVLKHWVPALKSFQPEFLFFSAGFDAHARDEMASLNWSEEDYYWVTQTTIRALPKDGQKRVLSTLEGGYELKSLTESLMSHLEALVEPCA